MDPVPDPLLLRKSGSAGNRTRDLCICSQKLLPLDHRGGRQQKNDLLHSSGTRKAFRGPKRGRFGEIEIEVAKYVADMRREGFPVTMESIQVKGREIARNLYISEFKASMTWCKRLMRRKWLVLSLIRFDIFPTRCNCTQFIYFWKTALHVSGGIFTHHQEHI